MAATFFQAVMRSSLRDFEAARARMGANVMPTPLLHLDWSGQRCIRLKAENLQPLGSFKIRCGSNVIGLLDAESARRGLVTVSAGNFAQGLALAANRRGVPVIAHVPEGAPAVKVKKLRSLGVTVVHQSPTEWWRIASTRDTCGSDGTFVHPVCDPSVVHGNGVIALELAEQWPQIDTVVVPFGGGGLATGIAMAFRALGKPVRIVACEVEGSAALSAARLADTPVTIEHQRSFVDGIGSSRVLDEMWPVARALVNDVIVVSVQEVKDALRTIVSRHHMVVEGAGAAALAAAVSARCGGTNVAAILSGGNIDPAVLCSILCESTGEGESA
jgi:threonine dehydratase